MIDFCDTIYTEIDLELLIKILSESLERLITHEYKTYQ